MRIFKFNLSANERVERKEDVDPSHLDPLADADDAGAPDDLQHPPERAQVSAAQEHGEDSKVRSRCVLEWWRCAHQCAHPSLDVATVEALVK